jgi:hypothetical protein
MLHFAGTPPPPDFAFDIEKLGYFVKMTVIYEIPQFLHIKNKIGWDAHQQNEL